VASVGDFYFVGRAGSYTAQSPYQDDQECINWYPEIDPAKNPGDPMLNISPMRGVVALYPTPGMSFAAQLTAGEVRALHVLPGRTEMLAISANVLWLVSLNFTLINLGTISTNTGQISITDNGLEAMIFDGANRYSYDIASKTLSAPLTDGPWTGGVQGEAVDNYIVYAQGGSQQWAATSLLSSATPALSFASKFGNSDNLVSLIVDHRQVYLLGETTSEVWIDVGAFPFPFAIIPGSNIQHGCAAIRSISRLGNSFALVTQDTRGQGIVCTLNGYQMDRISTHAVETTLVGQVISDAVAYTYQMNGHEFYVLTFPSINLTWVYDSASGAWHKWLTWNPLTSSFDRHRSNCCANFGGQIIVGDYLNGMLYSLSNSIYTENGALIRRLRRCLHLTADLQRQFFNEFQIQFQPGVGLANGQGSSPQAMLRWSDDGGSTWSNEHWCSIGVMGNYKNRAIWRRLGEARDRLFEIVVTDPVNAVIVSANLKMQAGAN
jgi:Phage stabilisation protein.